MSKRAKKFKVGDRVMMVGEVLNISQNAYGGTHIRVRIDGDEYASRGFDPKPLHPHTVRATPEARLKVAKKQQPTKGAKKK